MILLKYDTLAAIQCGYKNLPLEVLTDLGYRISFPEINQKNRVPHTLFFKVEHVFEPFPPSLEKSFVLDASFDP